MSEKTKIIALVGPTASGKSALAVALAKALGGEVVSCDSMQIYEKLNIGTATPTVAEMDGVPHHLISCVEPEVAFSCADYVSLADAAIADVVSRGKLPILCGGTGLYLDALLRGGLASEADSDADLRDELMRFAADHGNEALHKRLAEVDPISAAAIHPNNVKRVARALEIYLVSGVTKSELDERTKSFESKYDATVIGIGFHDRGVLYSRIDRRVDMMVEDGLIDETRELLADGVFERSLTAAQAIGYKEIIPYLEGKITLDAALDDLKRATRRYAKRQLTWFSAKDYVNWIYADEDGAMRSADDIISETLDIVQKESRG